MQEIVKICALCISPVLLIIAILLVKIALQQRQEYERLDPDELRRNYVRVLEAIERKDDYGDDYEDDNVWVQ